MDNTQEPLFNPAVFETGRWDEPLSRWESRRIEMIIQAIPDGIKNLVDVGCGDGVRTAALGANRPCHTHLRFALSCQHDKDQEDQNQPCSDAKKARNDKYRGKGTCSQLTKIQRITLDVVHFQLR